ncbi:hypothetical protein BD779DRAFT_1503236 [Infundibulicybe gibba]|nr:hypothetical protein BD779DRAFT_1503236 [Infundibulicybe gibba]
MSRGSQDTNMLDTSSNSSVEEALALRQKNRIINSTKKHAEADRLKNEGNAIFKDANYLEASRRYVQAMQLVGHTPVLMSNMAAVHLKLEQYDIAEWAATVALLYNPHMTKARYRRGVARSKQCDLGAAHADFETVLIEDPYCTEADQEMDNIQGQWNELEEYMDDGDIDAAGAPEPLRGTALEKVVKPDFDDDPWELSSVDSDSSDCQHVGNGIPCRFYNSPTGCSRNGECRFSHAPDDKSIRDRLGRNVCIRYLFNACRSGNTCNYSHSKTYLKPGQWDNLDNEDQLAEYEAAKSQAHEIKNFTQKLCQIPPSSPGKRAQITTEVPSRMVLATNQNRFVLLLSLENEDYFARVHSHLLRALNSKIRVQQAFRATAALPLLDSPDLAGVFVTDPGVARRLNKKVLIKLVEYAKAGGNVVIGGFFSTFISSGEFDSFFNKAWSIPWTQGSYHRTTFSLDRTHAVARRNPSLVPKYSMKAVHAANIRQGDAVYAPTDDSHLESRVFGPHPITDLSESPVTHTRSGKDIWDISGCQRGGWFNQYILAMLGLLDAPHTLEPTISPTPFVLVLSFDNCENKLEVVHGLSNSRNTPILKKVVEFTKRGGNVVLGGLFPGAMAPREMNAFFATNWDLPWKMSDYTSSEMVVNTQHPLASQNSEGLTLKYRAKSVFLSNIKPEVVVYRPGANSHILYSPSDPRAAIVHAQVGKGRLGFIGDVNPGPVVTQVVLAMLGL